MLSHKNSPTRVDGETFSVADSGREALIRGKNLVRLIRVVEPDSAAGFEFGAWVQAWRFRGSILFLARICCGGDVDVHLSIGIDKEGVHRMGAPQRQSRDD